MPRLAECVLGVAYSIVAVKSLVLIVVDSVAIDHISIVGQNAHPVAVGIEVWIILSAETQVGGIGTVRKRCDIVCHRTVGSAVIAVAKALERGKTAVAHAPGEGTQRRVITQVGSADIAYIVEIELGIVTVDFHRRGGSRIVSRRYIDGSAYFAATVYAYTCRVLSERRKVASYRCECSAHADEARCAAQLRGRYGICVDSTLCRRTGSCKSRHSCQ